MPWACLLSVLSTHHESVISSERIGKMSAKNLPNADRRMFADLKYRQPYACLKGCRGFRRLDHLYFLLFARSSSQSIRFRLQDSPIQSNVLLSQIHGKCRSTLPSSRIFIFLFLRCFKARLQAFESTVHDPSPDLFVLCTCLYTLWLVYVVTPFISSIRS